MTSEDTRILVSMLGSYAFHGRWEEDTPGNRAWAQEALEHAHAHPEARASILADALNAIGYAWGNRESD